MRWEDYKAEFVFDGAMRDLYIFQTTLEDWQTLLDFLRISDYQLTYTDDGTETQLPQTAAEIFKIRNQARLALSVQVGPMAINCHFFTEDDIEFDIDPREVQTEAHAENLFAFIRKIGQWLNKEVILTPENTWGEASEVVESEVMFRFHPGTGQIRHLPAVTQRLYPD